MIIKMVELNLGPKNISQLLLAIFFLQAAVIITIAFDITVARQVLSFVYLTFVPGFALIRLLRLKLEGLETLLYMVGLSIVFLMAEGLLLNLFGPLVGIQGPLGLIPIMVVSSSFVIISLLLRAQDNYEVFPISIDKKRFAPTGIMLAVILLLSIIGGLLSNGSSGTNVILLIMLFSIAILIGVTVFSKKLVPSQFYPILLFGIALALLLQVTLFSKYLVGGDIFGEYSLFQNTLSNLHWNSVSHLGYNAMLSITILPTIYSVVLNMDGTWVFKLVYPFIFAFVPLGLYQLLKRKFDYRVVFFSVFFFVSGITFYTELLQLGRQMIGELFYVLLFIAIFNDKLKGFGKWLLFIAFSFGLIVAHYSIAYIFLGSIIVVWIVVNFWKKRVSQITGFMILIFAVMAFAWFIYISSGSTMNSFINALNNIRGSFISDFFNPSSRSSVVLQAVGVSAAVPTFWHTIGRYVYYITEAFVLVGFLSLLLRKKLSFFKDSFNVLISFNLLLLIACVVIPNFAGSFNVTRFYHLTLFFLAPLCILGGVLVTKFLSRGKFGEKYLALIVLAVLIPFFLFQSGFVYEVVKDESVLLPLSGYRFNSEELTQVGVISNTEVSAAIWLSEFGDISKNVYSDLNSGSIFTYVGGINAIGFIEEMNATSGSYEYLMPYNLDNKIVTVSYGSYASFGTLNITSLNSRFIDTNTICSSESCVITRVP